MTQSPVPIPLNPFRPGAGVQPLYLAGRTKEHEEFARLLDQVPVIQNLIITGLRGVGKTVLLQDLKPLAQVRQWLWASNEISESASLSEGRIAQRLVIDLSTLLGPIIVQRQEVLPFGFNSKAQIKNTPLTYHDLWKVYEETPGFPSDKLKAVLTLTAKLLEATTIKGIVFAYDEAQNLSDHAEKEEYPLALLLDVFSYMQRQNFKTAFLLVLTGLPTLIPKLNEARTYTERMFHTLMLERLPDTDAREAIVKPIEISKSSLQFSEQVITEAIRSSGGYPFFIQYICKEVFDAWIGKIQVGQAPSVPKAEIIAKLDQDFFAPRWSRATDRQQAFMQVIATLESGEGEFTVPEIVKASKEILHNGFSPSHAVQILGNLTEKGFVYRNRRGAYCFAVPLLAQFIRRQNWDPEAIKLPLSSASGPELPL